MNFWGDKATKRVALDDKFLGDKAMPLQMAGCRDMCKNWTQDWTCGLSFELKHLMLPIKTAV